MLEEKLKEQKLRYEERDSLVEDMFKNGLFKREEDGSIAAVNDLKERDQLSQVYKPDKEVQHYSKKKSLMDESMNNEQKKQPANRRGGKK